MKKERPKANRILNEILNDRKYRKVNPICVLRGGKMSEEAYAKAMEEVKSIKNINGMFNCQNDK